MKTSYSTYIFNGIKMYLDEKFPNYRTDEENGLIQFMVITSSVKVMFTYHIFDTSFTCVAVDSRLLENFDRDSGVKERLPVLADFMTRVNYLLPVGEFRLDYDRGAVQYRVLTDFFEEEPQLEILLRGTAKSIKASLELWELYHGDYENVGLGKKTPTEAFRKTAELVDDGEDEDYDDEEKEEEFDGISDLDDAETIELLDAFLKGEGSGIIEEDDPDSDEEAEEHVPDFKSKSVLDMFNDNDIKLADVLKVLDGMLYDAKNDNKSAIKKADKTMKEFFDSRKDGLRMYKDLFSNLMASPKADAALSEIIKGIRKRDKHAYETAYCIVHAARNRQTDEEIISALRALCENYCVMFNI